jgi:hypothetical protein
MTEEYKGFIASFVHGYSDQNYQISGSAPALLHVDKGGSTSLHSFFTPREAEDFSVFADFRGTLPTSAAVTDLRAVPRRGLTGMSRDRTSGLIAAATHTGVHLLTPGLETSAFISHALLADIHGLAFHDGMLITALPELDLIVRTALDGSIDGLWKIGRDLQISCPSLKSLDKIDFRLRGKGRRGPMGLFHFNNVECVDGDFWVTSRNLGAVLSLTENSSYAKLVPVAHHSPSLVHDGIHENEVIYFTSIDGKIISANPNSYTPDYFYDAKSAPIPVSDYAASSSVFHISDVLGRDVSWMRGLDVARNLFVTTVDGIYGSTFFSAVCYDRETLDFNEYKVTWDMVGDPTHLRYVSGFDCLFL